MSVVLIRDRKRDWRFLWLRHRSFMRPANRYEREVLADSPVAYWSLTEIDGQQPPRK